MFNTKMSRLISMLILAVPMSVAMAADQDNRPERPKGPPQEAFTACESLSVDDACTVTTPRGEMSGTCKAAPHDDSAPLACAPEGGPGGGMGDGRPPRNEESMN